MKILVVFYSRTGTTRKVGQMIAQKLGADLEEIVDTVDRSGIIGYMKSGKDALQKKLTIINPVTKDPAEYDLVIIGTPNWGTHMASAIRTYITEQKGKIKKAAFFCTQGGKGESKLLSEMKDLSGIQPLEELTILTREVTRNDYEKKVDEFCNKLK